MVCFPLLHILKITWAHGLFIHLLNIVRPESKEGFIFSGRAGIRCRLHWILFFYILLYFLKLS